MSAASIDREEVTARLAAVMSGPWREAAERGARHLAPARDLSGALVCDWLPLASVAPLMTDARVSGRAGGRPTGWATKQETRLARLLRPHWEQLIEGKEIAHRDDVDQALTRLQLVELGIEMGYLDEDIVRDDARRTLLELLWSNAARKFVHDYDYLSLYYLAARVGVDIGQGTLQPPPKKQGAAVRFAAVLAEHARWHSDAGIAEFIRLMDDIRYRDDEPDLLSRYLASGRDPARLPDERWSRDRIELLADGAKQFVVRLCNIMDLVNADERGRVGLLYAYWLAKFFGWDLGEQGYYAVDEGWSDDVLASVTRAVALKEVDPGTRALHADAFRDRVGVLADAWTAVRVLEKSVRKTTEKSLRADAPVWIQVPNVSQQAVDEGLQRAAFWPQLGARQKYCTVPLEKADVIAPYIARAANDGSVAIRLVNREGTVTQRVFKRAKDALTAKQVLVALAKTKI